MGRPKDAETQRLSGRAEDNRLVHFSLPTGSVTPRPGDIVSVLVTQAAPFHLIADDTTGAPLQLRRTRAGDAWDRARSESCGIPSPVLVTAGGAFRTSTAGDRSADASPSGRVSLGFPTLRS